MKLLTTILLFVALVSSAAAQACDLHFDGWGTYQFAGGRMGGQIDLDTLGTRFTACKLPSTKRSIIWDDPTAVLWFECMRGYYAYLGSHNHERGNFEIGFAWNSKNYRYKVTEAPNRSRLRYSADGSCAEKDGF